jgi:hypothetical protein
LLECLVNAAIEHCFSKHSLAQELHAR